MRAFSLILIGTLLLSLCTGAYAQERDVDFGVMGGVVFAKLWRKGDSAGPDAGTGFSGGVQVRFWLSNRVTLEPQALFTRRVSKLDLPGSMLDVDFRADYIEAPVLLTIRFGSRTGSFGAKAFVGPSVAFRLSAKAISGNNGEVDITDSTHDLDFGVVGGIGADIGKLSIDARYTYGLSMFFSQPEIVVGRTWGQIGIYLGIVF